MLDQHIENIVSLLNTDNSHTWDYLEGFFYRVILEIYKLTNNEKFFEYTSEYYNEFIKLSFTEHENKYDILMNAYSLFTLFEQSNNEKYLEASKQVYQLFVELPKTSAGLLDSQEFFILLDNCKVLFFAIRYANYYHDDNLWVLIKKQILIIKELFYCKTSKLYRQKLIEESYSLNDLGFFAILLIDFLDLNYDKEVYDIFIELISGVEQYLSSNMWSQTIVNKQEGLLSEVSGTALLCYVFLYGNKKGFLSPKYFVKGIDIFHHLQNNFFNEDKEVYKLISNQDYFKMSPYFLIYIFLKRVQK